MANKCYACNGTGKMRVRDAKWSTRTGNPEFVPCPVCVMLEVLEIRKDDYTWEQAGEDICKILGKHGKLTPHIPRALDHRAKELWHHLMKCKEIIESVIFSEEYKHEHSF